MHDDELPPIRATWQQKRVRYASATSDVQASSKHAERCSSDVRYKAFSAEIHAACVHSDERSRKSQASSQTLTSLLIDQRIRASAVLLGVGPSSPTRYVQRATRSESVSGSIEIRGIDVCLLEHATDTRGGAQRNREAPSIAPG
jgi:hypothetical protein